MFGQKKKLLSAGAQGWGVVTKAKMPAHGREYVWVRAEFPDGSTGECGPYELWMPKVGFRVEGDVVPVRYDPDDHSKLTIDMPAMEQQYAQEEESGTSHLDAQRERNREHQPGSVGAAASEDGPAGAPDPRQGR
jgi:hypothetical protein